MTKDDLILIDAADTLRDAVKDFRCSFFTSLTGINNTYFLNLYRYLEMASFERLVETGRVVTGTDLKEALFHVGNEYCLNERQSAPFANETKNAAFLYNLCQMLNTPSFSKEMQKPQKDPALQFTQKLWHVYRSNWQKQVFTRQP